MSISKLPLLVALTFSLALATGQGAAERWNLFYQATSTGPIPRHVPFAICGRQQPAELSLSRARKCRQS